MKSPYSSASANAQRCAIRRALQEASSTEPIRADVAIFWMVYCSYQGDIFLRRIFGLTNWHRSQYTGGAFQPISVRVSRHADSD